MPRREINETDKAYIAGIIDGEGCIMFGCTSRNAKRYKSPSFYSSVSVEMGCKEVPGFLFKLLGGGLKSRIRKDRNRQMWIWYISGKIGGEVLKEIYPYLRLKKQEVELYIKFQETLNYQGSWKRLTEEIKQFRFNLIQELKELRLSYGY